MFRRANLSFSLISFLLLVVSGAPARAKTLRAFWIPQAVAPTPIDESTDDGCRFEFEQRFTPQRKAADRPGAFFEHGVGYQCQALSLSLVDVELGFDYVDAWDIHAGNLIDPFQFNGRLTYGSGTTAGWSAALGVDAFGLKSGENDFRVVYFVGQHRTADVQVLLGGYVGNDATLVSGSGKKDPNGAMFGLWQYLGRGRIGLEWQSGQNRFGYGAIGAEVTFDERLTAGVAYAIANDRANMRDWVLIKLALR